MDWSFFSDYRFYLLAFVSYLILVLIFKIVFNNKKVFSIFINYVFIFVLFIILALVKVPYMLDVLYYYGIYGTMAMIILIAHDFRISIESILNVMPNRKRNTIDIGKIEDIIVDSSFKLSNQMIGALITIEKHYALDQFVSKAIILNADVSNELISNIFIPNTDLHDGAVIIRGEKIVCAGAYFPLSDNEDFKASSIGSRHRAGLGISEVSDALSVIVSEETGEIEIATNGLMLKMFDKKMLHEYLKAFME